MTALQSIDATIRRRHLLKHPFYQSWSQGTLDVPTLRSYAGQYYHFESNFPRYVAGAYSKLVDPAHRRTLLENLVDEEGRTPTHPDLWLDFASALGVSRSTVEHAEAWGGTRGLCRTYEALTLGKSAAKALGALYAYESIFPAVAAEKSRGLREHYAIRGRRAHEFFRVHEVADVAHARAERELLRSVVRETPKAGRDALSATAQTLDAWWEFLDGFVPNGSRRRHRQAA